jgi:hypothetical protein
MVWHDEVFWCIHKFIPSSDILSASFYYLKVFLYRSLLQAQASGETQYAADQGEVQTVSIVK